MSSERPRPSGAERLVRVAVSDFHSRCVQACAEDPGVVLADTNAGHYIRYFTDCSVIANNFLLTEQQFQKADEVYRLFALPHEQLTRQAPVRQIRVWCELATEAERPP